MNYRETPTCHEPFAEGMWLGDAVSSWTKGVAGASLFFKMGLANRTTPERKAAGKDSCAPVGSLPDCTLSES
jgi:hypothetical protein